MRNLLKATVVGAFSTLSLAACDASTAGQTADFGGELGEGVGRARQALSVCVDVQRGLPGSAVEDTFLDAAAPSHASGSSLLLYSGLSGGSEKRSLLKFDLGFIPAGSVIDSATLQLYQVWRNGESTVRVHRVTAPWSEATATWESSASGHDAAVASTISARSQLAGVVTADLTALVQGWSDAGDNHGIALEEDLVLKTEFKSSEEANAARRPLLSVCYTAPTCDDGVQNQGESGVDCGGPCAGCPPQGVMITTPGEAYGHHGMCEGWNGCGDAATCALWACEINGYSQLVSYGADAPCTEFDNCHLFNSQGSIEWNWGNGCGVRGVTDIVCGSVPPPEPTCDDGVRNQGEAGVDCGGPCAACPDGVTITAPGEAYGHHGACEGWNGCGDAATCALWACEINGYSQLVSYGADAPCTEFDNCHLFNSQGSIEWNWGNGCGVRGVTDIVCGSVPPPEPTCDDGVQNQGEAGVDCGGPCAACPDGVLITAPGEAYGHHGACEGWNGCGDAATCALWACEINGYSELVSYGADAPCTEFDNCHLFNSQGSIEWNWGNSCEVRGVTDVLCAN